MHEPFNLVTVGKIIIIFVSFPEQPYFKDNSDVLLEQTAYEPVTLACPVQGECLLNMFQPFNAHS